MKEIMIQNRDFKFIVDDEDYERLNQFKWFARPNNSLYRSQRKRTRCIKTSIANEVLQDYKNMIDHIDINPLNNQKSNLRPASWGENMVNRKKRNNTSSKYIGVTLHLPPSRWKAQIGYKGRLRYIGIYDTELEAAKARDRKAIELFGEFAQLNNVL